MAGTGVSGGSGEAVTKEERVSLWWYVLAALLAVATIESLVGNQHLAGRDRPEAVGEGEA